jgi:small subunit ribosomal protein S8
MATSDPIADFLTRVRNAIRAKHRYVDVHWSKMKEQIARILKEEGFVERYLVRKDGCQGTLRVILKYTGDREPVIHQLNRISSPGRRHYVACKEIPFVMGGIGVSIVSTSKGVMTGKQACKEGVGGELLCKVW